MPLPDLWTSGRSVLFAALLTLAAGHAQASPPSCPQASMQHLVLPHTASALAAHAPVTIVAFGSSSTAGSGASTPDRTYPARLQALLRAAWPTTPVRVINAGIGGETADMMAARLERDVLARHPVLVIWQAGTNAALQHMDLNRFDAALDAGLRRLAAAGTDVVLMDNQLAPRVEREPNNHAYDDALAREAGRHHDSLFSRLATMRQWAIGRITRTTAPASTPPGPAAVGQGVAGMIGPDGLHHTDRGYACLAAALGKAIVSAVTPQMASAGHGLPY